MDKKTDRTMTIFGWSMPQLARACAVLDMKIETSNDACDVIREYLSVWKEAPEEKEIIVGCEREMDWDSARAGFYEVLKESHPPYRSKS